MKCRLCGGYGVINLFDFIGENISTDCPACEGSGNNKGEDMKPNELLLLRQKHGLSQTQAGRIIGVSGSVISEVETGKRKLKGFESAMLEDYFNSKHLDK